MNRKLKRIDFFIYSAFIWNRNLCDNSKCLYGHFWPILVKPHLCQPDDVTLADKFKYSEFATTMFNTAEKASMDFQTADASQSRDAGATWDALKMV